jgi:hypothetical protein
MRVTLLATLLALGGCISSQALEVAATRHDRNADDLAQIGDAKAARRERQRADNDRATAQIRYHIHGAFVSDVLLQ